MSIDLLVEKYIVQLDEGLLSSFFDMISNKMTDMKDKVFVRTRIIPEVEQLKLHFDKVSTDRALVGKFKDIYLEFMKNGKVMGFNKASNYAKTKFNNSVSGIPIKYRIGILTLADEIFGQKIPSWSN